MERSRRADAKLIGLGKRRLEQLVDSENEGVALRAATALYSYRAQQPPSEPAWAKDGNPIADRSKGVSIAALLEVWLFEAKGVLDDELADVVLRGAKLVRELMASGELSPTFRDVDAEQGVEKFTAEVERLTERSEPVVSDAELSELDAWRSGGEAA